MRNYPDKNKIFGRSIVRLKSSDIFFIAFLFIFGSCSNTEKTEGITAEITAAQIEGRKAARKILTEGWKDSTDLQCKLLEAKATQSKYLIEGKEKCAENFDSTFISTIKAVNPSLANSIKK